METTVRQRIHAPALRIYEAILDADAVRQWMVPDEMTSHVHAWDVRPGGNFRVTLTYDRPTGTGKSTPHSDTFHGTFTRLEPGRLVEQVVEFESNDPSMKGESRILYKLNETGNTTEVVATHLDLPPGLPPADNETGFRMALGKLARLVEGQT